MLDIEIGYEPQSLAQYIVLYLSADRDVGYHIIAYVHTSSPLH